MPDIVMFGKLKVTTGKKCSIISKHYTSGKPNLALPHNNISLEYSTPVILSDKDGKLGQLTWAILVEQISSQ